MRQTLGPIAALLVTTAALLLGAGLLSTLLPVRGTAENMSDLSLGLIGASYFIGFTVGCLIASRLLWRVGHIRGFAALAAVTASCVLVLPITIDVAAWAVLRAFTGFCLAGLYIAIESWLNAQATNRTRGTVISIYVVVNLSALAVSQQLLRVSAPEGFVLFSLAALFICLALVPIALTRTVAPAPPAIVRPNLRRLFATSPVAFVGAAAVGLGNGAFWAMAPVFGRGIGLDVAAIATFMSLTILGGVLAQFPLGRLSDRIDRRWIILGCAAIAAVASAGLALPVGGPSWAIAMTVLYGAGVFSLGAICLAHANDFAAEGEFVSTSAGLLLVQGGLAAVGPLAAGALMAEAGPRMLYVFTGLVYLAALLFTLYRMRKRDAPPSTDREPFVLSTRTSPELYVLDPRSPHGDNEPPPNDERPPVPGRPLP